MNESEPLPAKVEERELELLGTQRAKVLAQLVDTLFERMEAGDLRDICWSLGVDPEDVGSFTRKKEWIWSFVKWFERRRQLGSLLDAISKERPDLSSEMAETKSALQDDKQDVPDPPDWSGHDLSTTPPIPRGFVGRESELVQLTSELESPGRVLVWIGGIAGIGKTYLAAELYSRLLEEGKCQPIWFECKGQAVTIDSILETLAQLSGNQELIDSVQAKANTPDIRFRWVLGRYLDSVKAVLFLHDYDQLEPEERNQLLEFARIAANSAREAKIVLIGRRRPPMLDDPDVFHKSFSLDDLNGLPSEHVRTLVALPHLSDTQVQQVWAKCASGVPLALLIFAAAAKTRGLEDLLALPVWNIPGAKAKWLDLVIKDLPNTELECLKALSVFPAPVSSKALVAVHRSSVDEVQLLLKGLLDKGLLRHQSGTDHWSFRHETIREYIAAQFVSAEERNTFEIAGALYFLRYTLEARHVPVHLQGEVVNILYSLRCLTRYQETATWTTIARRLHLDQRTALQLVFRLGQLTLRAGDKAYATRLLTEVSDVASQIEDSYLAAQALLQLAEIAELNPPGADSAMDLVQTAVALLNEMQPKPAELLGSAYYFLALQHIRRSDQSVAEGYLTKGIEVVTQGPASTTRARLVGRLAYLYKDRRNFDQLRKLYESERSILTGSALAELDIGVVPGLIEANDLNDLEEALFCIEEAREIFGQQDNLGGVAYTYRLEASWHSRQGNLDLAARCLEKEIALRQEAVTARKEEHWYLMQALQHQFRFYLNTGQPEHAVRVRERFIRESAEYGPDHRVAEMYDQHADWALNQGYFRSARRLCEEANKIYIELKNIGGQAWIKRHLGDIVAAEGELKVALRYYEEGLPLRLQADAPLLTATDLEHIASFALDRLGDTKLAIRYLEQAQLQYERFDEKRAQEVGRRLEALKKVTE